MFASVIVGVAPGPDAGRAAAAAATIARAAGCPLVLAHVSQDSGAVEDAWLRELAASVCAPTVRTLVRSSSDTTTGLLAIQADHPDSLLCVASHGLAPDDGDLESTTAKVLRGTDGPLLVVGPAAAIPRQVSTIVVGFDGSPEAEAAAMTGAVWSLLLTASLHIVRVVAPSATQPTAELVAEQEGLHRELAGGLAVRPTWQVVQGADPAAALLLDAEQVDASLLVIGHDAGEEPLATTAARVVRDAPCPVLIARRPGGRSETS